MKARHLLALALLTACTATDETTTEPPTHTASTTQPDQTKTQAHRCPPADPDMTDPAQVADAAAHTLSCFDTAHDLSPIEATRRAAPYFQGLDHTPETIRTDQWWDTMATRGGYTQVAVSRLYMQNDPETPHGPTFTATRQAVATPTADQWQGPARTTIYEFTLAQTGQDWRITSVHTVIE